MNELRSQSTSITYGMPQGSLLDPKLFKIFADDLPERMKDGQLYVYADNATTYCVGRNVVVDNLNVMAKELNKWCVQNKLSVNRHMPLLYLQTLVLAH